MKKHLALFCCTVLPVLLLGGCSIGGTPKVNVGVFLADDIQNTYGYCPSLEVDVVAVTEAEMKRLESYNVDKYFADGNEFRRSLGAVTVKFSSDDTSAKEIGRGAQCWSRWQDKGATYLAVLSNLPYIPDKEDDKKTDPRKLIINMNDGFMFNSRTHNVRIGMSGVIEIKNEPDVKVTDVEAK